MEGENFVVGRGLRGAKMKAHRCSRVMVMKICRNAGRDTKTGRFISLGLAKNKRRR